MALYSSSSSYLMFFVTSIVFLISLAKEDKQCPFPVTCGTLSPFYFPFTNETRHGCGLMVVDKCNKTVQQIQLGKNGPMYNIINIAQDNSITLEDKKFQRHLNISSCESFNNLTLPPSTSFLSFQISSNLTLFKCPQALNMTPTKFNFTCNDSSSVIYYNHPGDDVLPSLPPSCSLIQLPVNTTGKNATHLFQILTGVFSVQIYIPEQVWSCRNCDARWDQCQSNTANFECPNKVAGDWRYKMKLGLGIGIPGLAIIIVVLSAVIIRYHKKHKYASANLHSGNNSSIPSPKSELEIGIAGFGIPIFSYSDLAEATNNFSHEKELGDGGFGTVYYGKLRDGREVAIKRLYEHNFRRVEHFMNEVKILTRLYHKNLVALYGCTCIPSQGLLLVYEFVSNGTVADHLRGVRAKPGLLKWPIRMSIAIETASALVYLHASDIIHRDVKTNNILLDSNFVVKIADFGLSRLLPNDVTHISTAPQGTPGYVDPEYHQYYQLTEKSDVYSFGVVLVELISSMPAVDMSRQRDEINLANLAINKIQKRALDEFIDPCLGYQLDEEVKRMITSVAELAFLCLQQDKEIRPSMDVVLEELERIKSRESKFEEHKEKQSDDEVITSTLAPPSPPDNDEDSLLKNIRLPPSSISVTGSWVSSSSTHNDSG